MSTRQGAQILIFLTLLLSLPVLLAAQVLLPDYIQVVTLPALLLDGDNGDIMDANEEAVKLYGYSRSQLREMNISQINTLSQTEINAGIAEARQMARNFFLFPHQDARGNRVWVEVHASPIEIDGDIYLLSFIHDVSAEREAREQLELTRTRLLQAEALGSLGHWEFDLTRGTVYASPEAMKIYGLEEREWTIEAVQTIPLPEYRAVLDQALTDLVSGEAPYDVQFRIRRASDGEIRHIHSLAHFNEETGIIFGTIQDVTASALLQERVERNALSNRLFLSGLVLLLSLGMGFLVLVLRRERSRSMVIQGLLGEKDLLLREVHHRIKNHMSSAISLLRLQQDQPAPDPESATPGQPEREAANPSPRVDSRLEDAAGRLEAMMLLYDLLYHRQEYRNPGTAAYINRILDLLNEQFMHLGRIRIERAIANPRLEIQMLMNLGMMINELVTNAVKHSTEKAGEILVLVSLKREDHSILVQVDDNGPGFPGWITKPGISSGQSAQDGPGQGPGNTGLGAMLVDNWVHQMKGSIRRVNSPDLGGARVEIRIPLKGQPLSPTESDSA